nr:MAG TPA: hypothetical protein [Caudoviricetes sp.]
MGTNSYFVKIRVRHNSLCRLVHTTTPRWLHRRLDTEVLRVCSVCCGGFPYTDVITRLYNTFTYAHTIVKHIFTPRLIYECPIQLFFSRSSTCIQVDIIQHIEDMFQKLNMVELISTEEIYSFHSYIIRHKSCQDVFFIFTKKFST